MASINFFLELVPICTTAGTHPIGGQIVEWGAWCDTAFSIAGRLIVDVTAKVAAKTSHVQSAQRRCNSPSALTDPDRAARTVPGTMAKSGIRFSHSRMKMRSSVRAR
jgi:hypothetical protein